MTSDTVDSAHVIRGVSESLRALLRAQISELSAEDAIVFDSPADIDNQGENRLSLYLYQIETNPYLRNLPPELDLNNVGDPAPSSVEKIYPPYTVDLVYLIVPYAKTTELELVIADKLVRVLYDFSQLPERYLHPVLKETNNKKIEIVPDTCSIDTLRHIWSGFPNKAYKLTKIYSLSPVRIPSARSEDVDMVASNKLVIEEMS